MLPKGMDREQLVAFARNHRLAVEASVSGNGGPQAAVVAIAVSDELELVFDTVTSSRKYQNLVENPRIALVIGWDREVTMQIEGIVDFPSGAELERVREVYFTKHPDGRNRLAWPELIHARVRPTWVRYSDFNQNPRYIVELAASELF
ncbi:MAG TPA: pyridoxamine 5'-phosphate oxidase family protein [Polyangiaceae bacterium]|nr:pyridoxamine 5'-phosphate oxidase family protein [Polyangiaceae bacterium]